MFKSINASLCVFLFAISTSFSQGISGFVLDEHSDPIPFCHVFVKQLNSGTTTDIEGKYFMNIPYGTYDIVFSSIGYETKSFEVNITDKVLQKNAFLRSESLQLSEIVVSTSKKDPAYEIIQKVIENKGKHLSSLKSARSKIYVKATELIETKQKEKKKPEVNLEEDDSKNPFEEQIPMPPQINMTEMDVILNYEYPKKYKEERTAVKSYGTRAGLYIPRFGETDFNFYRNLVEMEGIAESPIISPISRTSILSYKYQLESIDTVESNIVYKIKVIPRKKGNSTCKGYLYINDGIWNIHKLDFEFYKGGLRLYDKFRLIQNYEQINDTLWIANRQEFIYETKQGKLKTFSGSTILKHSNFEVNHSFPENFFGNEVSITTLEATKKDSSYWNSSRPEPLTSEEIEMVHRRDSVFAAMNTTEFKDSIEAKYNKVSLGEVLYAGVGFRDYRKKRQYYFGSLIDLIGFEVIGGFRLGPHLSYFKQWESGKWVWASSTFNVGIQNKDLQGRSTIQYLYNPFKIASVRARIGRLFYSINPNDAYLNQLKRSNYILNDRFEVTHRRELINGLYATTGVSFAARKAVDSVGTSTIIGDVIKDENPIQFEDYNSFITQVKISYTPQQRYTTEPTRKLILGSKYPTFSLEHRRGWNGAFSSDINFDYLEFMIRQKVTISTLGNSEYTLQTGKFINTKDLRIVDQKRFRQSDPYLYSDPLVSFQLLDTALIATQPYFEAHHIHHFNGALINNVPLVKKLRLRMVAGAGFLWVQESNYRHNELFVGTERVFKLGARRRLRIGVYGVIAESNQTPITTDFKISFDIIDTWKRDWSY